MHAQDDMRIRLLIIDPQNDFCDTPAGLLPEGETPALAVPGAHQDMVRLAALLHRCGAHIDAVAVTHDTHDRFHIAHPTYWRDGAGAAVTPFTPITAQDLREQRFATADPDEHHYALGYLDTLEAQSRYSLMVWPEHCIDGTWGHAVHPAVAAACAQWIHTTGKSVLDIYKGSNPRTEHYSAVRAEVPHPDDPGTHTNTSLLEWTDDADVLWVAGEAASHCVRATLDDVLAHRGDLHARPVVVIGDCMAPVAGFEALYAQYRAEVIARGVQWRESASLMAA